MDRKDPNDKVDWLDIVLKAALVLAIIFLINSMGSYIEDTSSENAPQDVVR